MKEKEERKQKTKVSFLTGRTAAERRAPLVQTQFTGKSINAIDRNDVM